MDGRQLAVDLRRCWMSLMGFTDDEIDAEIADPQIEWADELAQCIAMAEIARINDEA